MASIIFPILITFLHNLFTALWIGGMLALAFAVFPSIIKVLGKSKETKLIMASIKKKLSIFVYISMVGLLITGLLMANKTGITPGFLSFGNTYAIILSIKHLLYFVMIFLSIFRSLIIDKVDKFTPPVKEKLNMLTLLLNILVGMAVLFLSAYINVLANMPAM